MPNWVKWIYTHISVKYNPIDVVTDAKHTVTFLYLLFCYAYFKDSKDSFKLHIYSIIFYPLQLSSLLVTVDFDCIEKIRVALWATQWQHKGMYMMAEL